ncbi:MAG: PAS domain S-box protein [Phycisphaerales bacterium]|nr:PAS domain S-box protein [Phycisphaerales bacterium]
MIGSTQDVLEAVFNAAIDAIILIDRQGIIQTCNSATQRMFGYDRGELVGRNVNVLMPEPYRSAHTGYIERYLATGEAHVIGMGREVDGLHRDGSVFPVSIAVSEVDRRDTFVGILRDISAEHRRHAQLRQADRLASIGTLAAGLGHDMNNVLLPVRAHLNALSGIKLPSRASSHVSSMRESIEYLQNLAQGLHDLACDPDRDTSSASTSLRDWWVRTGPLLCRAAPEHVQVVASLPAELPAVGVAPHQLTQAVLNLLVNAGEAIRQREGVRGQVRIAARAVKNAPDRIRLTVQDNGVGMTEEVRRRAGELFFTTKTRGLGTGLGLALVKHVLSSVGGELVIESAPGAGTTIELHLPIAARPDDCDGPTAHLDVADERTRALIRQMLAAQGVRVAEDEVHAQMWIIEPNASILEAAARWQAGHPGAPIVCIGPLHNGAQARVAALECIYVVDHAQDFAAIRDGIARSTARLLQGSQR